jgi:hypothetical protein
MPVPGPKPTRAEAARLNGAKSRGPRTPEGKARSSRNALKHGLTAQAFALLPGEDADAYAALLAGLVRRYRPADELAAHLVQRLASVMWRQQRADRLEAEVLAQLEQRHDSSYIGGYVLPSSPHTWDAARFSAVQRQQARLDRTFFQLLDELDRLAPADAEGEDEEGRRNEPEAASSAEGGGAGEAPNEPEGSPPAAAANDDGAQNEPKEGPPPSPSASPPSGRPWRPGGEVPPLDPELEALLAGGAGGGAWRRSVEGRARQVADAPEAASPAGLGRWPAARGG